MTLTWYELRFQSLEMVWPISSFIFKFWSDKFGSQLNWKSKTWLFAFLNAYFSWIEWGKILISQLSSLKFRYFADQNGPMWGPHQNKFWHFSNTKMNITSSESSKSRLNKGVICLVSFFSSWVMVPKLPKLMHFLQICADLSKKSKSIQAIFHIHLKTSSCSFRK